MPSIHRRVWLVILATVGCAPIWLRLQKLPAPPELQPQLLYTTQGKTARINVDGTGQQYFDFQVPNQATWQPGPIFPDGQRLIFLSMEPRRDGPGKPFEEYYTQTPTHLWVHDLATGDLKEICTKDRLAVFVTPALLLGDDRMLIQVVRDKVGQIYSVRMDGSDAARVHARRRRHAVRAEPESRRTACCLPPGQSDRIPGLDFRRERRNSVKLIAADPEHLYFGTSWSPDGESVLYVDCHYHDDPGHDWADVCVGKADGSQHRVLTTDQAMWFAATYGNRETRGGGSNLAGVDARRKNPLSATTSRFQSGLGVPASAARCGSFQSRLQAGTGSRRDGNLSARPARRIMRTADPQ